MRKIIITVCFLFFSTSVIADSSGEQILKYCEKYLLVDKAAGNEAERKKIKYQDIFSAGLCNGYMIGFIEGQRMGVNMAILINQDEHPGEKTNINKLKLKIPKDVTMSQVVKIFVKYINNHPETSHRRAYDQLYFAITDAFPQN